MGAKVTGADEFARKLADYSKRLQRDTASLVKQEARALAVELGKKTYPLGWDDGNAEQFREKVRGDVSKVFAARSNPGSVYLLLQQHAPHLAKAYWAAIKSQKPRAAAEIVRRANLPTGVVAGAMDKARTGKRGGVPRSAEPVSLITESQLGVIQKRHAALVGLAKAAWYSAAKALGGRVRKGGGRVGKTEEIFPAWIRKLARKFQGIGNAKITGGELRPTVEISSSVEHAQRAIGNRLYVSALSDSAANLKKALADAAKSKKR
jgi:hypothetical protein